MTDEQLLLAESQAFLDELDRRARRRWARERVAADLRKMCAVPAKSKPPLRTVLAYACGKTLSLAQREYAPAIDALQRRIAKLEQRG